MRTFTRKLFIVLFTVSFFGAVTFAAQGQGDNLLTNPGFEAPYTDIGNEDQVAEGWTAWSLGDEAERPLYSPASLADTDRVREGTDAQKYSSFLATHTGGVYQSVSGLPSGTTHSFSVFIYVWSSSSDTDRSVSTDPGGVTVEVGIDAAGGIDAENPDIIWSAPVTSYDEYTQLSVSATPTGDTLTVFVRSIVTEAVLVTDIFLDEAALTAGVTSEITPEVTPEVSATVEAGSTEVVLPSETPTEAAIIVPTETFTLAPTIALPTDQPTIELSATEDTAALTATVAAINATASALFAIQTESAATLSAVPPTVEISATPDLNGTGTSVALQALATQGQVDFMTREAEGILTATALAASPVPVASTPTATFTLTVPPTFTAVVLSPTVIVVTATELPVTVTPVPTDVSTQSPLVTPEVPQGTPISADISESFPGRLLHTVQNRETVAELAARYGSSTQAIVEANGLNENALIYIGQLLIIPVRVPPLAMTQGAPGQPDVVITSTPQIVLTGNEGSYVVQSGDTLSSVASKFNTTVTTLAQLNGIVNVNRLEIGQVLIVPGPSQPDVLPPQAIRETYTVRYGDTLNRLALRYGLSAQRIAEVNRIANIHLIYAGQTLLIPVQ